MLIDRRNCSSEFATYLALQPATQQSVDKQLGFCVELTAPRHDHTAFRCKIAVCGRRVPRQTLGIRNGKSGHHDTVLGRNPGDYVAVAGVVTGTTNHLPAFRIREVVPCGTHRRDSGTRHQRVTWNALVLDRGTIYLADAGYRINLCG